MASTDPFAATGGGVQTPDGAWLPKSHPKAQQYLPAAGAPAAGAAPVATTVPGQAAVAQTYTATPGAAPTAPSTNAGTQDVVRNSYLQQATQGTVIDQNDPNFRQQADTYAASQERARRNQIADNAEAFSAAGSGMGGSGAQDVQNRLTNERAAQGTASFEAELVGRELTNRREEVQTALSALAGMGENDQTRALQRELAELDAQIRRAGIASSEKLGMAGIAVDRDRLTMQDKHFGLDLGFRIGDAEAGYNERALRALMV
jgi:hypothetical protein